MPIYEYRCAHGHTFEVMQSMSADPVATCEVCSEPVERVFHPIAVHFKGSGFYTTDYARKGAAKAGSNGGSNSESDTSKSDDSGSSEPSSKKASEKTASTASKD